MSLLDGFRDMDMIEQIVVLEKVREEGGHDEVVDLMALYEAGAGDDAVDEMVYHALYDLLEKDEDEVIRGIAGASSRVRELCLRRVAAGGFAAAVDPLLLMLADVSEPELVVEGLRALKPYVNAAVADAVMSWLTHADDGVAGMAMEVLAASGRGDVLEKIIARVRESGAMGDPNAPCDLRLALSISAIAAFDTDAAVEFMVDNIHHSNPMLRRLIISSLGGAGERILPHIGRILDQGSNDEMIMGANVLGRLAVRKGADILLARLERPADANLRFAIYESLGKISSMRSLIGLGDGLGEEDDMVLLAVVNGLENLFNPGVMKPLLSALRAGGEQGDRIIRALVASRAGRLFTAVLAEDDLRDKLFAAAAAADAETVNFFTSFLQSQGREEWVAELARRSKAGDDSGTGIRILAVDDSRAILAFYRGAAAGIGATVVCAGDGVEALDRFRAAGPFDLVVTDMNMPNMDGIEFTRRLRDGEKCALPVLMATTESEQGQKDIAAAAGVSAFISKPFNVDEFRDKVDELIK